MIRILTHTVHTGYEYEMSKIPNTEFYSVHIGKTILPAEPWSEWMRPQPENYHVISEEKEASWYDLIIVHTLEGYDRFKHMPLPMIYKVHTIDEKWRVTAEMQDRVSAFVFNQKEAADAWMIEHEERKRIIPHSIDFEFFKGWTGAEDYMVTAGVMLQRRHDKGSDLIRAIDAMVPLVVSGGFNEDFPVRKNVQPRDYEEYRQLLQDAKAYFCPGPGFSMTALEAMCTGTPIITMPTQNMREHLVHYENCLIATDLLEAEQYYQRLVEDEALGKYLSENARLTVMTNFNPLQFQIAWDETIKTVTTKE